MRRINVELVELIEISEKITGDAKNNVRISPILNYKIGSGPIYYFINND